MPLKRGLKSLYFTYIFHKWSLCIFLQNFCCVVVLWSNVLNQFPSLIGVAWVVSWLENASSKPHCFAHMAQSRSAWGLGEHPGSPSSEWLFPATTNYKLIALVSIKLANSTSYFKVKDLFSVDSHNLWISPKLLGLSKVILKTIVMLYRQITKRWHFCLKKCGGNLGVAN